MSNALNLGSMNGPSVGIILKEVVRRAMVAIRNERSVFEVRSKEGHSGEMDDVFTSADRKAQDIYQRVLSECFPSCGIVAEEGNLAVLPRDGCTAYFTVDPLDGTKAYIRRQSNGVGTMAALVEQGQVISAYVGDVFPGEIYGYRPGSDKVHCITNLDVAQAMEFHRPLQVGVSYVLLRDPPTKYSALARKFVEKYFGNHENYGGSIGTWMTHLWKRVNAAVIIPPSYETPWDSTPIIGISRKLGYLFFRPSSEVDRWEQFEPQVLPAKYRREHEMLVIHENDRTAVGL